MANTIGQETDSVVLRAFPAVAVWENNNGTLTPLYSFYNTGNISLTWNADPSSGNTSDASYYEITSGDGAVIQYPKQQKRIDGTTGAIVSTTQSSDGNFTNIGTMQFTTKFAPKKYSGSSFAKQKWVNFIHQLTQGDSAVKNKELLLAFPTGQSYEDIYLPTGAVEGWYFMFGKLTSDITHSVGSDNPTDLQLTFSTYRPHSVTSEGLGSLTSITLEVMNGTTADLTVSTPTLTSSDAAVLIAGDIRPIDEVNS